MLKIILKKYNYPFSFEEQLNYSLKQNEIRITTKFAGISFTDVVIKKGFYAYQKENFPLPLNLGFEASGVITEIGESVVNFMVGDTVAVLKMFGCFSEEIIAVSSDLIHLDKNYDLDIAASLPVNFITAYHALHNIIKIFEGSNILVTSAAGGVGGMIVQLASKTATVTGVVRSAEKFSYVKNLGANNVVTYDQIDDSVTFDVMFISSGQNLKEYQRLLNPNGKIVIYGFNELVPDNWKSYPWIVLKYISLVKINPLNLVYSNQTFSGFNIIKLKNTSKEYMCASEAFKEALATNSLIQPTITKFNYTEINKAFAFLESGKSIGKIVLEF